MNEGVWVPISRGLTKVDGDITSKKEYMITVQKNVKEAHSSMKIATNP